MGRHDSRNLTSVISCTSSGNRSRGLRVRTPTLRTGSQSTTSPSKWSNLLLLFKALCELLFSRALLWQQVCPWGQCVQRAWALLGARSVPPYDQPVVAVAAVSFGVCPPSEELTQLPGSWCEGGGRTMSVTASQRTLRRHVVMGIKLRKHMFHWNGFQ